MVPERPLQPEPETELTESKHTSFVVTSGPPWSVQLRKGKEGGSRLLNRALTALLRMLSLVMEGA